MSQDDSSPLTRDIAPFGVRMPPDLKERVAAAAKANNRSMNAEIVAVLEEKYPAYEGLDLFELGRITDHICKAEDDDVPALVEYANLRLKNANSRLQIKLVPPKHPGHLREVLLEPRPITPRPTTDRS